MQMSAAALPPIHGEILPADRKHPRFAEYQDYRSAMSLLLVRADGFRDWLHQREAESESDKWVKHPRYAEFRAWMCATKAGGRRCPEGSFPHNFKFWLGGGRW
jgi:hypothetical protein